MSCTGEMEVVVSCGTAHKYVCQKFKIILQNKNSDKISYIRMEREMYNIVICDDEKDIVEAIAIYLNSQGYNVLKAYNVKKDVKAERDILWRAKLLEVLCLTGILKKRTRL